MIKGGGGRKSYGYSADLMVCFPSRTHLSLQSKPFSSPRNAPPPPPPHHHRRSLSKLSGVSFGGREEITEPTSPKVTCAGQIKVRPSKNGEGRTKNWQSLMAEMEKLHKSKTENKFFGIKKDILGFLTCLRNLRFDFRCFGAFPPVDALSDDEEEEEEEEEESSGTVFSKWFMVLHEKQNDKDKEEENVLESAVPPPNALLLMRCRSAPVKSWLEETEEVKQSREGEERVRKKKDLRSLMEEEEEEEKNVDLVVMSYDTNYYKLSSDIAKETWVVGGIQDPLFRSRSSKI